MIYEPKHHAITFSTFAKVCSQYLGDEAEAFIKDSVITYAYERSRRMKTRAMNDGCQLNAKTYMSYGEIKPPNGTMIKDFDLVKKDGVINILKCPWYDAWQAVGHVAYGKLFCSCFDEALALGFDRKVGLQVTQTITEGSDSCKFVFKGSRMSKSDVVAIGIKNDRLGDRVIKPIEYHIGHLYSSLNHSLVNKYGRKGKEIISSILNDLEQRFGYEFIELLKTYSNTDYAKID